MTIQINNSSNRFHFFKLISIMQRYFVLLISTITVFLLLITSACSPAYPDGPSMSIYSVRNKITNKWKWALIRQDAENQTGKYVNYTIEFKKDGSFAICENDQNCKYGLWTVPGKKKAFINFIYPEKDSAKELNVIRLNRNAITLETTGLGTKDSNYVKWELETINQRWF